MFVNFYYNNQAAEPLLPQYSYLNLGQKEVVYCDNTKGLSTQSLIPRALNWSQTASHMYRITLTLLSQSFNSFLYRIYCQNLIAQNISLKYWFSFSCWDNTSVCLANGRVQNTAYEHVSALTGHERKWLMFHYLQNGWFDPS